jgi:exosome complex component RRP42
LPSAALEDKSEELTAILSDVYSRDEILPSNLIIIPGKKVWTLQVDVLVLSEDGNLLDILFMAVHAALYDCRVPSTRSVQYKARASIGTESGLDTRSGAHQDADFELKDYWDEGEPLSNQGSLPVAITFHLVILQSFSCRSLLLKTRPSMRPITFQMRLYWKRMRQREEYY